MTFDLPYIFGKLVHLDTVGLYRSNSMVKIIRRSQEENVAKVIGATSSEGFLVS